MKATVESTNVLTELAGVPVRLWQATTEDGAPFQLFVHRVGCAADGAAIPALERALLPQTPPADAAELLADVDRGTRVEELRRQVAAARASGGVALACGLDTFEAVLEQLALTTALLQERQARVRDLTADLAQAGVFNRELDEELTRVRDQLASAHEEASVVVAEGDWVARVLDDGDDRPPVGVDPPLLAGMSREVRTLIERLHLRARGALVALRWIARAPDTQPVAVVRQYAADSVEAVESSDPALSTWVQHSEERLAALRDGQLPPAPPPGAGLLAALLGDDPECPRSLTPLGAIDAAVAYASERAAHHADDEDPDATREMLSDAHAAMLAMRRLVEPVASVVVPAAAGVADV